MLFPIEETHSKPNSVVPMKNYKEYSTDDFIADDSFIHWVKFPNEELESFWSEFIAENPDKLMEIEEAIRFLKLLRDQTPTLPADRLLGLHQQINDRIDVPVSASTVHQIMSSRSRRIRTYFYAAAATIGLLAIASWALMRLQATEGAAPTVVVTKDYSTSHLLEHVIPRGKRSRITLGDGTQIWVNADSKLKYPNDFMARATRDVYLEGEAYFDVAPDSLHPFIVHVQGVEVKVLGTSFNIKGYEGEPKIEATLVHGKISIEGDSAYDHITLAANQRAVFLKENKRLVVENNVETDTYTAWRKGVLVFEDEPLSEIFPILQRTFNVTIHTSDAASLDCRFTAKISNKSLEEVLELFRTSDKIRYTIVANDVYINGGFCDD